VEKEVKACSDELLQVMRARDLDKFSNALGTFYINVQPRPSIADKEKAFAFLREQGCGSIIVEGVNWQTLGSTVRELMDAGKMDLLTCENVGIKVFIDESVRNRKK
jgi:hypothetical protein